MGNETHVTVAQPSAPPTSLQAFRSALAGDALKQIANYYGGREEEALRFATGAVEYVRRVPKLLECDRTSLIMAFVQSAQFRFMPSGVGGEAYVIPYGKEAKFQIGYQGYVTLLYRSGKVKAITANIIYANDEFDYQEGLEAHLVHKPAMFGKARGEPIGAYTIAQMAGGAKTFKVMDKAAIMEIKDLSKAKDAKASPWNSDQDPELWMWKKTCLIQHAKLLPKTQDIQRAFEVDFEGEGMEKPRLDPGGPAVGRSFHDPAQVGDAPADGPEMCPAGKHSAEFMHEGKCAQCKIEDECAFQANEDRENGKA